MNTSPLPLDTQAWILTFARRGWKMFKIARALQIDRVSVADCLDGWGIERARRRGRREVSE